MNLESNIEKLEKKVEKNANKIEDNAERIRVNSLIIDILKDYKKETKILYNTLIFFGLIIVALIAYIFIK